MTERNGHYDSLVGSIKNRALTLKKAVDAGRMNPNAVDNYLWGHLDQNAFSGYDKRALFEIGYKHVFGTKP